MVVTFNRKGAGNAKIIMNRKLWFIKEKTYNDGLLPIAADAEAVRRWSHRFDLAIQNFKISSKINNEHWDELDTLFKNTGVQYIGSDIEFSGEGKVYLPTLLVSILGADDIYTDTLLQNVSDTRQQRVETDNKVSSSSYTVIEMLGDGSEPATIVKKGTGLVLNRVTYTIDNNGESVAFSGIAADLVKLKKSELPDADITNLNKQFQQSRSKTLLGEKWSLIRTDHPDPDDSSSTTNFIFPNPSKITLEIKRTVTPHITTASLIPEDMYFNKMEVDLELRFGLGVLQWEQFVDNNEKGDKMNLLLRKTLSDGENKQISIVMIDAILDDIAYDPADDYIFITLKFKISAPEVQILNNYPASTGAGKNAFMEYIHNIL